MWRLRIADSAIQELITILLLGAEYEDLSPTELNLFSYGRVIQTPQQVKLAP